MGALAAFGQPMPVTSPSHFYEAHAATTAKVARASAGGQYKVAYEHEQKQEEQKQEEQKREEQKREEQKHEQKQQPPQIGVKLLGPLRTVPQASCEAEAGGHRTMSSVADSPCLSPSAVNYCKLQAVYLAG